MAGPTGEIVAVRWWSGRVTPAGVPALQDGQVPGTAACEVPGHPLRGMRCQAGGRTAAGGRGAAVQRRGAEAAAARDAGDLNAQRGWLLDRNACRGGHDGRRCGRCGGGAAVGHCLDGPALALGNWGRRRRARALISSGIARKACSSSNYVRPSPPAPATSPA